MEAVDVLGKESHFSQETRGITTAAKRFCENGEGCATGGSPKGPVTQLAEVWETGGLGAGAMAAPGATAETVGAPV